MFINLTRHGGDRALRVAGAAIAYLDVCEGGTAVHLIGGETLRVHEDIAQIEACAVPQLVGSELVATTSPTMDEIVAAYRLVVERAVAAHDADLAAAATINDPGMPAPKIVPLRKGR